jgi:hypothetical protein
LAVVTLPTLNASLLAPWVGPNIRLGEDPARLPEGEARNQAEPHVVRSVTDPDLLLATFQEGRYPDGGGRNNGYAVSEDGGFTWRRALNPWLTVISNGSYFRATDPVAGIAHDGTFYLNSLVALDPAFDNGRVVIQRSDNRGSSWTGPISIYSGQSGSTGMYVFPDKNWMVVNDYPDSSTTGRVVVTWTDFRVRRDTVYDINDALIRLAWSDDRGDSWSGPVFVTPPEGEFFSQIKHQGSLPVFLPGGGLALVFHSFDRGRIEVIYSADDGESFPYPAVPANSRYFLYDAPNMREGSFLPTVSVARETGDLFIAYVSKDFSSEDRGHVYFVRSSRPDPGQYTSFTPDWRFSTPVKVSGVLPFRVVANPTIAVSPDGRRITIYFYDNRNGDEANNIGDFYGVISTDGGSTWSDAIRITETSFDIRKATETNRGYMLGDYFGLAAPTGPDQAGVAVWVDTRLETADPWSARIATPEDSMFAAWLQAQLPYSAHSAGEDTLRNIDLDRDGTPNLMEYILGQSPRIPEPVPSLAGISLLRLSPDTDPATSVETTPGLGRWPTSASPLSLIPETGPHGEGYWETLAWIPQALFQNIAFTINGSEYWYLLDESVPFRWVKAFEQGWCWSPWFGYLNTVREPWLFHLSLGWVYESGGYLYSPHFNTWLYPSLEVHPWVYKLTGGYLYLIEGSPWVYDTSTGSWTKAY